MKKITKLFASTALLASATMFAVFPVVGEQQIFETEAVDATEPFINSYDGQNYQMN
jgi:hypothetical protein